MKKTLLAIAMAGAALSGCAVVPAYGPPGVYAPPPAVYVTPRPYYYGYGYRPYGYYGHGYYGRRW